ncbi:winged helix-turn-helix transcriptional regulator (plasmid) [Leuconostoc pseudomesenteroides]|uniref:Winged helix-turn-helix transcriptional regulator n=1 Tax=Leuconostoc pseudomesenteroides TaxID=33968 RepID=A0A5B8T819_LEUPS|nr:winged helix-turn-helix domain-containing protein [Leuconostoc pseudomesenteroides]QEA43163.1 winged helix-turn-helix transcriptional regulator [Leuconostoc pseudomesenteroides]
MSENLKTIRELADELGVSKQAIQYHIKSLTNKNRQKNDKGIVVLSIDEQRFIRDKVDKQTNKKETNRRQTDKQKEWDISQYLRSEIEEIKKNRDKQLAVKDRQIENKDSQISQMQNLLDQQQRLALQDKKLLEEYKAEIKELKALAMPSREVEKDVSLQSETEQETKSAEPQTKPKKWWQFKKRGQKND